MIRLNFPEFRSLFAVSSSPKGRSTPTKKYKKEQKKYSETGQFNLTEYTLTELLVFIKKKLTESSIKLREYKKTPQRPFVL
jgi:hypothetical protein